VTVPFFIRETFFGADDTSGELVATGLVLAALVALMLMRPPGGTLSVRMVGEVHAHRLRGVGRARR
jgi:hypothetical protein